VRSKKVGELAAGWVKDASPAVRLAAAQSLGWFDGGVGSGELTQLAKDAEASVSFVASAGLAQRGQLPWPGVKAAAKKMIDEAGPVSGIAARVIVGQADAGDADLLRKIAREGAQEVRAGARLALTKLLPSDDAASLDRLARDTEVSVIMEALTRISKAGVPPHRGTLTMLTLDPSPTLAWRANAMLQAFRPAEAQGAIRFDIETSHPYLRQKWVRELGRSTQPWAGAELEHATENAEPHTRCEAFRALTKVDPARARPALLRALKDDHGLVRLQASALLASIAAPADAAAIESALPAQKDEAARLYLLDALALAKGQPLPAPPAPARSIAAAGQLAWLSDGCDVDSPYTAYYHTRLSVTEPWRKASRAGKIFIARVSPAFFPGYMMVGATSQDEFWTSLNEDVPLDSLPFLDGLVFGEETMTFGADLLWGGGWRLFCREAGIAFEDVQGDVEKLNAQQKRAWNVWAQRRIIEGFNRIYDYTKLRFGKLRPGIQVATFMGEQGLRSARGPMDSDFEWKFDVGGIYQYFGQSRKDAYALVRRYKTIWPDRPVIWLSHGIGVHERTPVKYDFPVPSRPLASQTIRAFSDSVTAYAAGAQVGWFSFFPFQKFDWVNKGMSSLAGPTIKPEDLYPGSKPLQKAIEFSFKGLPESMPASKPPASPTAPALPKQDESDDGESDATDPAVSANETPATQKRPLTVEEKKARFETGFQLYGVYLKNLARLFGSLPAQKIQADALVIEQGLNVWEGTLGTPGSDLLSSFDFLLDINQLTRLDLAKYRFILVKNPPLFRDETIRAIGRFLREQRGVLYVHQDLGAGNGRQASTPEDWSGSLKEDWPWERDLSTSPPEPVVDAKTGKVVKVHNHVAEIQTPGGAVALRGGTRVGTFRIKPGGEKNATVLFRAGDEPVLVIWRSPDHQGVVIFDAIAGGGKPYRDALREAINAAVAKHNVGRRIEAPARFEVLDTPGVLAAATSGSTDPTAYAGLDGLNGYANPTIGPDKSATLQLRDYARAYVAGFNGVAVIGERKLQKAERIERGVLVQGEGLLQACSATGVLRVEPVDGPALKAIDAADLVRWVIEGTDEGVGVSETTSGSAKGRLYFVRCGRPVRLVAEPAR